MKYVLLITFIVAVLTTVAACEPAPATMNTPLPKPRDLPANPSPGIAQAAADTRSLAGDTKAATAEQRGATANIRRDAPIAKPSADAIDAAAARIDGNMDKLGNQVAPKLDSTVAGIEAMRQQYTQLRTDYDAVAGRVAESEKARAELAEELAQERNSSLHTIRTVLVSATAIAACIGAVLITLGVMNASPGMVIAGVALIGLAGITGGLAI